MAIDRTLRDDFDWPLFISVSAIALFGVANLYSATDGGVTSDAYAQQFYWLTLGFAVASLTSRSARCRARAADEVASAKRCQAGAS